MVGWVFAHYEVATSQAVICQSFPTLLSLPT
jgi:hypothetical protein